MQPDKNLLNLLEDVWEYHMRWFLITNEDGAQYVQDIAEVVYSRDQQDPLGPPPGRTCTGVVEMPAFEEDLYIEIPVEHLNRKCLAYEDDGRISTRIDNGCAYIPISDFNERVDTKARQSYRRLLKFKMDELPSKQQSWITEHTPKIRTKIDQLLEAKNHEKLFDGNDEPTKLEVLSKAVRRFDRDDIEFDTWLTAEELYDAVDDYWYHPTEYQAYQKLESPLQISVTLSEHEDHHLVDVDRSGRVNKYKLYDPFSGYVDVDVSNVEDILELPCFQNIDDYLKDRKPTRWVLYSIARVLMSLDNNFTIDDMVKFYSRYPWFDEATTRYQLNYERVQKINGEAPLPIGCNNDHKDFGTFCIGQENCDYSIYQSLPMRDEIYERLESDSV